MNYPIQYIDYLYHFHVSRDYFECHECLEELWKLKLKKEEHWTLLIQLAVALYHYRREEYSGAYKLLSKISKKLPNHEADLTNCGLDFDKLHRKVTRILEELEFGLPYQSFNLPISDQDLLKKCQERALENHLMWGNPSDMSDDLLIHKHKMRDRSEIINTRLKRLKKK